MQTVKKKITDLIPASYNPRKDLQPGQLEYDKLKKSIEVFGYVEPVIWNKKTGNVVGGHQRLKVMKDLGFNEIQTVVIDMPEEKEKLLNVALNKISGDWDNSKLADLFEELKECSADLLLTGFDQSEIDELLYKETEGLTDEDAVPEPPKEPKSKLGDLYILGNHRLLCGDSTKIDDVERLMNGEKADMVFTDPPYGVSYEAKCDNLSHSRKTSKITGDNMTVQETSEKLWRPAFRNLYESSKDDCAFYMTMCQGGDQMMMMMMMMSEHWQIKHEIIWVKNSPVFSMGRLDYDYQHEPILYGWKKKHNFYAKGDFTKSIWQINRPTKSDLHPTMKPIAIIENALLNSSVVDNICIDLFLGSGSTMIACEKTGRRCYGMEIDPIYCDVIVKRWEDFTGRKAVLSE